MSTLAEKIAVMQAFADGKYIQSRYAGKGCWSDYISHLEPAWNWSDFDYRVKPEPREWWINIYEDNGNYYMYPTKEQADTGRNISRDVECVHVREVIEFHI